MIITDEKKRIVIVYKNYKGVVAKRTIVPLEIRFASTMWHPEEQWLLEAFDVEKNAQRSFALRDILNWGQIRDCGL